LDSELTFGSFLREKRLAQKLSLRDLVAASKLSLVQLSNMENDRRPAPKGDGLDRLITALKLDKEEKERMYDLAAESDHKVVVPGDLPEYIMEKDIVRVALRTAKYIDATDEEWQDFIERLRGRIIPDDKA